MLPRSFLLRYARRNLWRSRGRTLLVLTLITPVFLSLLLMLANSRALEGQVDRLSEESFTLIQVRGHATFGHINQAGGLNRLVPANMETELAAIQHVVKVEPYLVAIEPVAGYYMTLHIGVRPGDARRLATHGEVGRVKIVTGRDLTGADEGKDVALLGLAYARKMGITLENFRPGESVFVKDVLRDGEPGVVKIGTRSIGGRPFRVVGLFTSGYAFGDNQMFLPYRTFQRHYGIENKVSKFFLRVDRVENVLAVTKAIQANFSDLDVITRTEGARFLSPALATMRRIGRIWVFSTVILAGAMVLFAMLLAADERIRELGTLKALGASSWNLAVVVITESALLAGAGATLATVIYVLAGKFLGLTFFKATFGVYLPGHYGESLLDNMLVSYALSPGLVGTLVLAATLTGLLGSLYALWRVHRLSPVEALRQ
ncbi:MAG: FtsX-like permease family protein [Deltaproteobacteria bacterium]|nr:FtsX-like permease family protein [Deltaproteobacteria bacterium]